MATNLCPALIEFALTIMATNLCPALIEFVPTIMATNCLKNWTFFVQKPKTRRKLAENYGANWNK